LQLDTGEVLALHCGGAVFASWPEYDFVMTDISQSEDMNIRIAL